MLPLSGRIALKTNYCTISRFCPVSWRRENSNCLSEAFVLFDVVEGFSLVTGAGPLRKIDDARNDAALFRGGGGEAAER